MIRRWRIEGGDTHVLGLVRVGIGVLLFWQSLEDARALAQVGPFADRFHVPMIPWEPPRSIYVLIVAARLLFAAMATVGQSGRAGLLGAGALGLLGILWDRLAYQHDRFALFLFAILFALAPCDRSLSLEHPEGEPHHGPLWAQRLAQIQASIIYAASGLAHLSTWSAGGALAKGVIATELFLSVGLWFGPTRVFALWLAVWFHLLTLALVPGAGLFALLMLLVLALFSTPDVHARKLFYDPARARGGIYAKLVGALDWLARFDIRPWAPDDIRKGHHMVIVRRDGSRATGIRAFAMVARCTPLLFLIWAPVALLASFTKGGDASAHS